MEELLKKIEQILDQYFLECQGNRINQWAWGTLKNVILDTIRNHKPKMGVVKDEIKK